MLELSYCKLICDVFSSVFTISMIVSGQVTNNGGILIKLMRCIVLNCIVLWGLSRFHFSPVEVTSLRDVVEVLLYIY